MPKVATQAQWCDRHGRASLEGALGVSGFEGGLYDPKVYALLKQSTIYWGIRLAPHAVL